MIYKVKSIKEIDENNRKVWDKVPPVYIDNYLWDENGYKPKTEVKMFHTKNYIKLKFVSEDIYLKAVYEKQNETVYKDSCVEFFFNPNPKYDYRYINFEMNVIGTIKIGIGASRESRQLIQVNPNIFKIKTTVNKNNMKSYKENNWTIEYCIPIYFIEEFYGKDIIYSGSTAKGNFYKCGDETKYPHFGCWNPIINSFPDFHRPEFFGDIVFL